jgi:hypothetical protein
MFVIYIRATILDIYFGEVMLTNNPTYLCIGFFLLMAFMLICAGYAYRVNARLAQNDPKKRDFHIGAIFLAPITWILFLLASITIFILRVVFYVVFLALFAIAVLAFRKPFLFVWLDKIATKIGNKLLEANTFLIKVAFGKPIKNPQT